MSELMDKVKELMVLVQQNQAITWTPVINQTAEDHRKEVA